MTFLISIICRNSYDFLFCEGMSQELISSGLKWTSFAQESRANQANFKMNHLDEKYSSLYLKRQNTDALAAPLAKLNDGRRKLPKDKYKVLLSLCKGQYPVIREEEYANYYKHLPHE